MVSSREWVEKFTGKPCLSLTADYLQQDNFPDTGPFLCIDSSVVLTPEIWNQFEKLNINQVLEDKHGLLGYVSEKPPVSEVLPIFFDSVIQTEIQVSRINHPMDWVRGNAKIIQQHIALFCKHLSPEKPSDSTYLKIYGEHPVYFEEGVIAMDVTINCMEGSVYIGKNALLMEGTCIRGPVSIGEGSVVKMGTQIYGGTSIGRYCTIGGEIKNSLISDFSNKAHHGYLGDSMIGQWCNLGAGTTNSNVKNNAGLVKMWNEETQSMNPQGQKAGLLMGDFSKSGINTGFQTGSVIGVCCSIHEPMEKTKNVRSFTWGNNQTYLLEKALEHIKGWYRFKNQAENPKDAAILRWLFQNEKHP
jgi:UDP-N-acetylglucosamine diphosphorylase/glucosamine-1-phosphate N-acetyltransferase